MYSSRWHVGSCNSSYLPQSRGFDSFRGVWHAGTDHYNYITETGLNAYDLHYNDNIDTDNDGTYSSVSIMATIQGPIKVAIDQ